MKWVWLFLCILGVVALGCSVQRDTGDRWYIIGGGRTEVISSLGSAERHVGALHWPTDSTKVASGFGMRRGTFHEGIDIPSSEGAPVFAAHDGEVVYRGDDLSGYGKTIAVREGAIVTVYAHLDTFRVDLYENVSKGEVIGEIGETGRATGPHLHFEVRVINKDRVYVAVDPMIFYGKRRWRYAN